MFICYGSQEQPFTPLSIDSFVHFNVFSWPIISDNYSLKKQYSVMTRKQIFKYHKKKGKINVTGPVIHSLTQQPVANDTKWTHLIFPRYIKGLLKREKSVITLSSSVVFTHSLVGWHINSARIESTERDARLQHNRNTCALVRHD